MSRRALRHEREPRSTPAQTEDLTERQRKLRDATLRSASEINEQLMMLRVNAGRLAASEGDIRAVRDDLLTGHLRECQG